MPYLDHPGIDTPWASWKSTDSATTDIAETLATEHRELTSLAAQIRALVPETDHRSVDQRRRLVRKLRIRAVAHARAIQGLFPGSKRMVREHDDLAARLDQLQVIPLDHPLWIVHFDELEQRLTSHIASEERDVLAEIRRRLDAGAMDELGRRYLDRQSETLAQLERPHPGRRAIRRLAARAAS